MAHWKIAVVLLLCSLAANVTTKTVFRELKQSNEVQLDSFEHSVEKRAFSAIIAVAPLFSAIFGAGRFAYGVANGQMRLAELKEINSKMDSLQESVDDLAERVESLERGQEWLEGVALYGKDVQRLRYLLHEMKVDVVYCDASGKLELKSFSDAKSWADTVLDNGPDGLGQVLFNMHDLVMGTTQVFGRKSLIAVYKDQLGEITLPYYPQQIEDFVQYIMALQTGGYAAISTAMNLKGERMQKIEDFIKEVATPRMEAQWIRVSEIVGIVPSLRYFPSYSPPFHIAADGYGDLGARFVDLNGDGKIDMVYHRWISSHSQQKGAYLNNGNGWTSAPQYTPPFHIAADGYGDLGARYVDLDGDKAMDLVYHRWINGRTQQKGAYITRDFFGDHTQEISTNVQNDPDTC